MIDLSTIDRHARAGHQHSHMGPYDARRVAQGAIDYLGGDLTVADLMAASKLIATLLDDATHGDLTAQVRDRAGVTATFKTAARRLPEGRYSGDGT